MAQEQDNRPKRLEPKIIPTPGGYSPRRNGRPPKTREDYAHLSDEEYQKRLIANQRRRERYLLQKAQLQAARSSILVPAVPKEEEPIQRLSSGEQLVRISYRPKPHQKAMGDAVREGKRIIALIGGRQCGKTHAGVYESLRQIYTYPREPYVGWIVSPTYPMSEIVQSKFEEIADKYKLILRKFGTARKYWLTPPQGVSRPYEIYIRTAEWPDRLRGATLSFIWLDEAAIMSPEVFELTLPMLMYSGGPMFITTTPKGKNWVYSKVMKRWEEGDPSYAVIKAKTIDNDSLDPVVVEALRGSMSKELQAQELEAEIVSFEGLVYRKFDPEKHVIKNISPGDLPQGATIVAGIDVGYRDPFVHLIIAKCPDGSYIVLDEYYATEKTIDKHAEMIKNSPFERMVIRRWRDPSAPQEGEELKKYGISSMPAKTNDIEVGIDLVKRKIESNKLFVCERCVNTLLEFSQYHYSANGPNTKRINIPVDEYNHAMDALRYALISEEGYNNVCSWGYVDDLTGEAKTFNMSSNVKKDSLEDWIRARASNAYL